MAKSHNQNIIAILRYVVNKIFSKSKFSRNNRYELRTVEAISMVLISHSIITDCNTKFAYLVPRSLLLPKRVGRDPEFASAGFFCSRSSCKDKCMREML